MELLKIFSDPHISIKRLIPTKLSAFGSLCRTSLTTITEAIGGFVEVQFLIFQWETLDEICVTTCITSSKLSHGNKKFGQTFFTKCENCQKLRMFRRQFSPEMLSIEKRCFKF